jgi:hypothetical protein
MAGGQPNPGRLRNLLKGQSVMPTQGISPIRDAFDRNIGRVQSLISVFEEQVGVGKGRHGIKEDDILRAAVVFLHASMEDLLRSIERLSLPTAASDVLDGIALAGRKRGERFQLGSLVAHRGKTVDQVIADSVDEHLGQSTYNNEKEVAAVVQRAGVDPKTVAQYLPALAALTKRRHNIVHRADRNDAPGSGHHAAQAINKGKVRGWAENVEKFADVVLKALKQ